MRGGIACAENACKRRQEDKRQNHGKIFDDEPADSDTAAIGLHKLALLHCPKQHHGACY
jgi:hypothetical protein